MVKKRLLIAPLCVFSLFTGCHSFSVNKVVRDIPSPNGEYHVEVRQCRASDAMFGKATKVQVSVLKKGEVEQCRSFKQSLAQFDVYSTNFKGTNNALLLKWISDTELQAWHHSFAKREHKDFIGPHTQAYSADKPITFIFSP